MAYRSDRLGSNPDLFFVLWIWLNWGCSDDFSQSIFTHLKTKKVKTIWRRKRELIRV